MPITASSKGSEYASIQNVGLVRISAGDASLQPIPIPHLEDDYLLIQTEAVALNPTDWTTLDAGGAAGTLVGCDSAGTVLAVGSAVTRDFRVGDRVCGIAHGGNDAKPWTGAFASVIVVKGDLAIKIPDGVTWEEACTVGVGVGTVGFALYKVLGLPWPEVQSVGEDVGGKEKDPILIYGGSTASGSLAIQFAKLSGRKVITTCSPANFQMARARGADAVYDYRESNVGKRIREETDGKIREVFNCVSLPASAQICADAIGAAGGMYVNLLGIDCPRKDVESIFFLGYSLSGEDYIFEENMYPADSEAYEFGKKWMETVQMLWAERKWIPHPHRVGLGGLGGIVDGLQEGRDGKIRGEKRVYRMNDSLQL